MLDPSCVVYNIFHTYGEFPLHVFFWHSPQSPPSLGVFIQYIPRPAIHLEYYYLALVEST